jgi:hypothetical protein
VQSRIKTGIGNRLDPDNRAFHKLQLILTRTIIKQLATVGSALRVLFSHKYASDIFSLFRSWHNLRALDPYGPWCRLTIAIAYATEAHLFISDLNQSPFNVGTRLTLEDLPASS